MDHGGGRTPALETSPGPALAAILARPALFVALVATVVHAQVLGFGFTHLDDQVLVLEAQPLLREPGFAARAFAEDVFHSSAESAGGSYYRPGLTLSFIVDALVGGDNPAVYHATNLALHAGASALIVRWLVALGVSGGWSLFLALAFAVHPAFAAVTAWIPGRNESLLVLAAIPSFLAYRRWMEAGRGGALAAHLALWGAALLVKENALVLPLVGVAHELFVRPSRAPLRRFAAPALGWIVIAGAYLAIRGRVLGDPWAPGPAALTGDLAARVAAAVRYLGIAVFPVDLSLYPTVAAGGQAWGLLAAVGLTALLLASRATEARRAAFGLAWFTLFLAPSLAVPMGQAKQAFFDARLYPSWPGLALALACLAPRLARVPRARTVAGVGVLAVLAATTFVHSRDYRDRRSFWAGAARDAASSAWVLDHQADTLWAAGRREEAVATWERALELDPSAAGVATRLDRAYSRLGLTPERRAALEREVGSNAANAAAWYWLGVNRHFAGDTGGAVEAWTRAVEAAPDDPRAYAHLVLQAIDDGDLDAARAWAERARLRGVVLPEHVRARLGV